MSGNMQKRFFVNLLIVSVWGILLTTVALYGIQSITTEVMSNATFDAKLDDVAERIKQNDAKVAELNETIKEDYLSRARALAMMIKLEPEILNDIRMLNDVAKALSVDELHVIDENGILRWGTWPVYYGMDFNSTDQTRPFLAILEDPTQEIAQDPMPNGSIGVMRQYAGVSLIGHKGIAQIGMDPMRLEAALRNNRICNVLNGVTVGNNGYVFAISGETAEIASHPNASLIGGKLPEPLAQSGVTFIDGVRIKYKTRMIDDNIVVAAIPVSELFSQRNAFTMVFMVGMTALFTAFCLIVNKNLKVSVLDGLSETVYTLEQISAGNLDVTADVRTSREFVILSDGINHMLSSLKTKMSEAAAMAEDLSRYGVIIASSGAGVIIKDKNGVITDWNRGAQNIIGYTAAEMIGRMSDTYLNLSQRERVRDVYEALNRGISSAQADTQVTHKDGRVVICSTSHSPIYNADNRVTGSVVIFHDVTSARESEIQARNMAAIVAIADAGIIVKDTDGIVREWNIGAQNILGFKPLEIIGQTTKYYAPEESYAQIDEIEERLAKGEHIAHMEVCRKHKDEREIICSASYTPIWDDMGFAGSVAIFHDISDKKQIERALQEAVVRAEEASKAKSTFLANVSHEIRTPMNGVIGLSELALGEEGVPEKVMDYLVKINISANGLLGIINDVLDLSKIEAGKIEIEKTPFSLYDILDQCQVVSGVKAKEKGLTLSFFTEAPYKQKIIGDPTQLRQVLLNLLSNAIKFTAKGSVTVSTIQEQRLDHRIRVYFEVKDTGIGMTQEQSTKVFEPFTQADSSTTRKFGGTGLGLSICKNIIALMGGVLQVQSVFGIGSKFYFTLDFDIVDTTNALDAQEEADLPVDSARVGTERPVFSGLVLVCEDNTINQQVIAEHLKRIGLRTVIARHGLEGVEAVQAHRDSGEPFDLIFMDIHMPVMDGMEAAKKLAELGNTAPVVALTANAIKMDIEKYLNGGMNGYLAKPFVAHELYECLLQFLKPVSRLVVSEIEVTHGIPPMAAMESSVDTASGLSNVAGNLKLYERLLAEFSEQNKETARRLREKLEAGQMDESYRIVHSLKSVSGMIGAKRLRESAEQMQQAIIAQAPIADLLKKWIIIEDRMSAVLCELKPYTHAKKVVTTSVFNRERALALFETLEPLLASGDSRSLTMLSDISETVSSLGEHGALLTEAISDYEFERALELLQQIKDGLQ